MIVVIDSSVLIADKFRFHSQKYLKLLDLHRTNIINVLIPDIVKNECKPKYIEEFAKAEKEMQTLKNAANSGGTLISIDVISKITELLTKEKTKHILSIDSFIEYFTHFNTAKTNILDQVMTAYFKMTPPFTQKKKSEFPDAIILYSILHAQLKEQIVVISKDTDWKCFAESHDWGSFVSIEDFLSAINTDSQQYEEIIETNIEKIIQQCLLVLSADMFEVQDESDGEDQLTEIKEVECLDYSFGIIDIKNESPLTAIKMYLFTELVINAEFSIFDINSNYSVGLKDYLEHDYIHNIVETEAKVIFTVDVNIDSINNTLQIINCSVAEEYLPIGVSHGYYDQGYK